MTILSHMLAAGSVFAVGLGSLAVPGFSFGLGAILHPAVVLAAGIAAVESAEHSVALTAAFTAGLFLDIFFLPVFGTATAACLVLAWGIKMAKRRYVRTPVLRA